MSLSRRGVFVAFVIVVSAAIVMGAFWIFQSRRSPTVTTREITVIGGETKEDQYVVGFALLGGNISSPGPTIRVRKGHQVTITFKNVHGTFSEARIAHDFVVVAEKDRLAKPLWARR